MFVAVLLLAVGAVICDDTPTDYKNYALVKVSPKTDTQLANVKDAIAKADKNEVDEWNKGSLTDAFDIFLSPAKKESFLAGLKSEGIEYELVSDNMQQVFDAERRTAAPRNRAIASFPNSNKFMKFLQIDEVNAFLKSLQQQYSSLMQLETIGTTFGKNPIVMAKVGSNIADTKKPIIWIDAGIHAREWATPATSLYILNQLLVNYNSDKEIKNYLDKATFLITPVLNPDGYNLTFNGKRVWRKNIKPSPCRFSDQRYCCMGVDLNRNFDASFGGAGTSGDPCEDIYRGPKAFSELETIAIRDTVLKYKKQMKAFISLHAYSQMIFYPYGDRKGKYTPDHDELDDLGKKVADGIRSVYGTEYSVGTPADLIYEAAGGSIDWVRDSAGVKYSYALELRPSRNSHGTGFSLPVDQIIPTAIETYTGLRKIFDKVVQ